MNIPWEIQREASWWLPALCWRLIKLVSLALCLYDVCTPGTKREGEERWVCEAKAGKASQYVNDAESLQHSVHRYGEQHLRQHEVRQLQQVGRLPEVHQTGTEHTERQQGRSESELSNKEMDHTEYQQFRSLVELSNRNGTYWMSAW